MDLHCHTLATKSGDGNRTVSNTVFASKIKGAGVKVVAITNHNKFDKTQFDSLVSSVGENAIIWPGVELDVYGNHSGVRVSGHILVVANPNDVEKFDAIVDNLCGSDQENFSMDIDDLPSTFASLGGCMFICHHHKKKEISKEDIDYLKANISQMDTVVLEPSTARKAGMIVREENETCWFGSDVKDWSNYPGGEPEKMLPNCSFGITSYDRFVSLLKKDNSAVLHSTVLSPKQLNPIVIAPFDDLNLSLSLFNDVNVIFGGKATGKTEILKAIEAKFKESGKKTRSYYIEQKADALKSIVNVPPDVDTLSNFAKHYSENEISTILKWSWHEIPSLKKFKNHYETVQLNDTSARLAICKATFSDSLTPVPVNEKIKENRKIRKIVKFYAKLDKKNYLSEQEATTANSLANKMLTKLESENLDRCIDYKAKCLEKWTIDYLKKKIANVTSIVEKPSSVGFNTFADDYYLIKNAVDKVIENMMFEYKPKSEVIGEIPLKGKVRRRMEIGFSFQKSPSHSDITGGKRYFVKNGGTQDLINKFKQKIKAMNGAETAEEISAAVSNAQEFLNSNNFNSLECLLNYSNFLETDTVSDFFPSNGVTSILLVDSAVSDTKVDVIILDEPDGGMGSDFVNMELLPKILKRASENKVVVIGTHDPNLVVRTHPYCCIYRVEDTPDHYLTYIGNSFEDYLVNVLDDSKRIPWIEACIEKCEGGQDAIGERERTYGYRN